MIRMKVFEVMSGRAIDVASISLKEKAPIEEFIHLVGYENIKQILSSSPTSQTICYTIFYEDNQPYTPYVEDEPKKKGLFG